MAEVQRDTQSSREDTLRFLDMVGLFSSQAMMALGKVANPATGKADRNLPAAQLFIDMLDMLERKTRGNLTRDEERLLRSNLTDLRLMYAEEAKSPDQPAPAAPAEPAATPASGEKTPGAPGGAAETGESAESKVKFHKSYGEQ